LKELRLKPLGDRVIVREATVTEASTEIGIALVNTTPTDDQLMRAEVLAVGPGKGNAAPVKTGDIVLVPRYQGWEVKRFHLDGAEPVRMYSFDEVLAVRE
jgi:co-chaperonin GroES (HSP10)